MIIKKILFSIIIFSFIICLGNVVLAEKNTLTEIDPDNLPEKNGIYKIKNRPDLKLRVFINPEKKNARVKPSPAPTPGLVCNLSDPDSGTLNGITGWHLPPTIKYYLNIVSTPSSINTSSMSALTDNSFEAWTDVLNNKVTVTKAGTTTLNRAKYDGKNLISWGRASTGTLGITYAWYYSDSGLIAEVDTILNNSYKWQWSDPAGWNGLYCAYENYYDAQNILTHEIGHWFGADDGYQSQFENNTMYGYGDITETKKDTLTTGDITAIQSIY